MKFKSLIIFFAVVALFSGCAAIKQAVADKQLSDQTPIVNGETSPQVKAQAIGNTVSGIASATPAAPLAVPIGSAVAMIAGWFFSIQRGAQLRKNGGVAVAGPSSVTSWSGLVQDLANAFAGAFTTAPGSPSTAASVWQRVWKGLLATGITGAAGVIADPSLANLLAAHPVTATILGVTPSLILGIEKLFSNVPVVVPATTTAKGPA